MELILQLSVTMEANKYRRDPILREQQIRALSFLFSLPLSKPRPFQIQSHEIQIEKCSYPTE